MAARRRAAAAGKEGLALAADVLVVGGGPSATWAALSAAERGASVVLVDKGYCGTSGATAPANTGTWFVPPGEARRAAVEQRLPRLGGLADPRAIHRTLDTAWERLHDLAAWGYAFPDDEAGRPYLANLRGPDYMRFMRRRILLAGVEVLDHHPALELLGDGEGAVVGAAGIDRKEGRPWTVRAGAVVLATGGCAFGERMLGATGLTGDGYLMAAEAGAVLTGMEFSSQYGLAPFTSSLNKGLPFFWATFYREDGTALPEEGGDRQTRVARALLDGPVLARLDKASPELRDWLRRGQPNCFLPYTRMGVDPFEDLFPVTLRCEGTTRGTGGIRLAGDDGATGIPGLYAAGDAASRQALAGAVTGGGGPNASWAIASGAWAGRGAAAFALRQGGRARSRRTVPLGTAGLRPAAAPKAATIAAEATQTVRAEMLPLDKNFFRTEAGLRRSLDRLDAAWADIRDHLQAEGVAVAKAREAAAMTASARWSYASSLARPESRGMHRRLDRPTRDEALTRHLIVSGIDRPRIAPEVAPCVEAVAS